MLERMFDPLEMAIDKVAAFEGVVDVERRITMPAPAVAYDAAGTPRLTSPFGGLTTPSTHDPRKAILRPDHAPYPAIRSKR